MLIEVLIYALRMQRCKAIDLALMWWCSWDRLLMSFSESESKYTCTVGTRVHVMMQLGQTPHVIFEIHLNNACTVVRHAWGLFNAPGWNLTIIAIDPQVCQHLIQDSHIRQTVFRAVETALRAGLSGRTNPFQPFSNTIVIGFDYCSIWLKRTPNATSGCW